MIDERSALLYAKLNAYKYLVNKTERFLRWSLTQVKNPYVACSFGKDSSVMLHLILKFKDDIPVRFATHPETNILNNYSEVEQWWIDNHKINLQEIFCEGGLVKVKHHQRIMLNEGEWDSFFVGIRAQESVARRMTLSRFGKFHKLKNGRIKISPLAWWSEREIGVYMIANKLPFLDDYKFSGISSRTSSGIPRTMIHESLQQLKNRDILAFNKLCELFEDAKYYV